MNKDFQYIASEYIIEAIEIIFIDLESTNT